MVERDLVLSKAATIDRCLARVAEVRSRPAGALLPVDIEDIVVLNVTRAVQAAADLAAHVVAAEGYGLPDSLAAAFTLLEGQGVIDAELAAKMRQAMAFPTSRFTGTRPWTPESSKRSPHTAARISATSRLAWWSGTLRE